jgi:hypothetical protein
LNWIDLARNQGCSGAESASCDIFSQIATVIQALRDPAIQAQQFCTESAAQQKLARTILVYTLYALGI